MIVTQLLLVLWVGPLLQLASCSVHGPSEHVTAKLQQEGNETKELRTCTVQNLLPLPCQDKSQEWSDEYIADLPYDCTCAATKARYFCPDQRSPQYPMWEPFAVSEGLCRSTSREDMVGGPFPPNSKILLYGNSHIRQVSEAMACMFPDDLGSKRVKVGSPGVNTIVPGGTQCRACSAAGDAELVNDLQRALLSNQCIAGSADCRCNDDASEYFFENGAILHYTYASGGRKTVNNARHPHGMDPLSSYTAVFMNVGNGISNATEVALRAAGEVQAAGTPFFWLSTYEGIGRISEWDIDQRRAFLATGASYVDIESMARGMDAWTKGVIEGVEDGHFCLPGPPNEIALLLIKIVWAAWEQRRRG